MFIVLTGLAGMPANPTEVTTLVAVDRILNVLDATQLSQAGPEVVPMRSAKTVMSIEYSSEPFFVKESFDDVAAMLKIAQNG